MATATMVREPKHVIKRVPLRVLGLGNVKRLTAEFNGQPYTGRDLITAAGGTAQRGMGVRIGSQGFGLDDDTRPALLLHLQASAGAVAEPPAAEEAVGVPAGTDAGASETVQELTVLVAENVTAGK